MMITIDPDDTELKDAIQLVEQKKRKYETAEKRWNRTKRGTRDYVIQEDDFHAAREAYESALVNLALIIMERL